MPNFLKAFPNCIAAARLPPGDDRYTIFLSLSGSEAKFSNSVGVEEVISPEAAIHSQVSQFPPLQLVSNDIALAGVALTVSQTASTAIVCLTGCTWVPDVSRPGGEALAAFGTSERHVTNRRLVEGGI